jgi:hypothetical protein
LVALVLKQGIDDEQSLFLGQRLVIDNDHGHGTVIARAMA